jgi:serine/threonine protein phosphatase PrpC
MADTDVFGILSLLLAAGGAAYLIRARIVAVREEQQFWEAEEESLEPLDELGGERSAATIPPKLRPPSDPPKAHREGSGHPDRWYRDDLAEEARRKESEAKAADKTATPGGAAVSTAAKSVLGKDTLPSNVEANAKFDGRASLPPSGAVPVAPQGRSSLPKSSRNPPAAKITMVGAPPHATPAKGTAAPLASSKDKDKERPPPSSREVAKSTDKDKKPSPAAPVAKVAPVGASATAKATPAPAARGAAAEKAGSPAPSSTRTKSTTSTPQTPSAKKLAELNEVPRIDVEEDEDVEPTRVGRLRRQIQPPVVKIVFDTGAEKDTGNPAPKHVVFAIAQTDPGKRRKQNEDSYLILEDRGVYVVADGMGGHRGGQFASKLAVKTIGEAFALGNFEAAPHPELPLPASELARAIQMANASILEEATRRPELKGMGTTLCSVRFSADRQRMYLGHVGDSRCYRVRDGVMKQITTDHTMADYGVAGPEGAHLSRALGVWPTVPIDLIMAEAKVGDLYLLCSDGLTKMLADGTIATQLLHEENPKAAIERLVFFANAHGGKDNITIILMRIVEPGWKPPEPPPAETP